MVKRSFSFLWYLSEAGSIDRLHGVLAAKVHVVEVDDIPGDADTLGQLVVLAKPAQRGRGRMRFQPQAISVMVRMMRMTNRNGTGGVIQTGAAANAVVQSSVMIMGVLVVERRRG